MAAPDAPARRASPARETSLRRCFSSIHAGRPDGGAEERKGPRKGPKKGRRRSTDERRRRRSPDKLPPLHPLRRSTESEERTPRPPSKHPSYTTISTASSTAPSAPRSDSADPGEWRPRLPRRRKGFRTDYALGEAVRSSDHAIEGPVECLSRHDFAFVRRSAGHFSYAILAFRFFEPVRGSAEKEECMTFVVSADGSTKMVKRRHWAKRVRLASSQAEPCQEIQVTDDDEPEWAPPSTISFANRAEEVEECSMLSSVSHRAMIMRRSRRRNASPWRCGEVGADNGLYWA